MGYNVPPAETVRGRLMPIGPTRPPPASVLRRLVPGSRTSTTAGPLRCQGRARLGCGASRRTCPGGPAPPRGFAATPVEDPEELRLLRDEGIGQDRLDDGMASEQDSRGTARCSGAQQATRGSPVAGRCRARAPAPPGASWGSTSRKKTVTSELVKQRCEPSKNDVAPAQLAEDRQVGTLQRRSRHEVADGVDLRPGMGVDGGDRHRQPVVRSRAPSETGRVTRADLEVAARARRGPGGQVEGQAVGTEAIRSAVGLVQPAESRGSRWRRGPPPGRGTSNSARRLPGAPRCVAARPDAIAPGRPGPTSEPAPQQGGR